MKQKYDKTTKFILDLPIKKIYTQFTIWRNIMNFLFSADLHGNLKQYEKLFDYAKEGNIPYIVLGGDLSPKSPELRNPQAQADFFKNYLFHKTSAFKGKTLLILGNDDYRKNLDLLINMQDQANFKVINTPCDVEGYTFIGYSYVPFTPFMWKDWERRDLASDTLKDLRPDVRTVGKIDFEIPHDIVPTYTQHSIEQDVNNLLATENPDKTILITHAPPYNTVCDLMKDKQGQLRHIGSLGIRKVISERQPLLTLHGHIHDSVENSKSYVEHLNRTACATVGNDHLSESIYVLNIMLESNVKIERLMLK